MKRSIMLGQSYEQQAERTRAANISDALKQRLIKEYLDNAAQAYSKIVTRYPAMPRYQDARRRLAAIERPVPTPTPEAIALEQEGAGEPHRHHALRALCEQHGQASGPERRRQSRRSHAGRSEGNGCAEPGARDQLHRERRRWSQVRHRQGFGGGGEAPATKLAENQPAPRSAEPPSSPNDVPAPAPDQLNESASSPSGDQRRPMPHRPRPPRPIPPKTIPRTRRRATRQKRSTISIFLFRSSFHADNRIGPPDVTFGRASSLPFRLTKRLPSIDLVRGTR